MPSELTQPAASDFPTAAVHYRFARTSFLRFAVLITTFLMITGCGTGGYKQRSAKRLAELRRKSNFLKYLDLDPYEVSDPAARPLGVTLRLPKGLLDEGEPLRTGYTEKGREGEYVIPEARVQPPFLTFRGFCISYERFLKTTPYIWRNRELPVYGYFAVTPVTTPDGDPVEQQEILDEIQKAVAENFAEQHPTVDAGDAVAAEEPTSPEAGDPESSDDVVPDDSPFAWKSVTLGTPDDGKIEVKLLRIAGQQLFDGTSRAAENTTHDGKFEVYVYSDDTYHVVVAWRAPTNIDNFLHLMEAGRYSVGTIQVNPPPPPPEESEQPDAAGDEDSGSAG